MKKETYNIQIRNTFILFWQFYRLQKVRRTWNDEICGHMKKITITKNWVSMCKFVNDCSPHLRKVGARVSSIHLSKADQNFITITSSNWYTMRINYHFKNDHLVHFCRLSVRIRFMYCPISSFNSNKKGITAYFFMLPFARCIVVPLLF